MYEQADPQKMGHADLGALLLLGTLLEEPWVFLVYLFLPYLILCEENLCRICGHGMQV